MENYRAKKYCDQYLHYENKLINKSLKVEKIKGGYILPLKHKKGGVLNKNKKFVKLSFHNGEWFKYGGKYQFNDKNALYTNRTVVYLGLFIHQWGHFLLDSLSRSWILTKLNNIEDKLFVFISKDNRKIDGNYIEALQLLGIKREQIVTLNTPLYAKTILVPEMATTSDHQFTKKYEDMFNLMISNANTDGIKVPSKVYLTRTGLKLAQQKEFGEKIIQKNFEVNGFKVLHPEKLNLREQIAIFQNAKYIACLNGSIPFNLVFASKKIRMIIINKCSIPHINLKEIASVQGISPEIVNGFYEPISGYPQTLGDGPFLLMFGDELKKYFQSQGWKYLTINNDISKSNLFKYEVLCYKYKLKNILRKLVRNNEVSKKCQNECGNFDVNF